MWIWHTSENLYLHLKLLTPLRLCLKRYSPNRHFDIIFEIIKWSCLFKLIKTQKRTQSGTVLEAAVCAHASKYTHREPPLTQNIKKKNLIYSLSLSLHFFHIHSTYIHVFHFHFQSCHPLSSCWRNPFSVASGQRNLFA